MTPDQFRTWRKAFGMTQADAGQLLDRTRRAIIEYEDGTTPVPWVVEQACARAVEEAVQSPADEGIPDAKALRRRMAISATGWRRMLKPLFAVN